MPTERVQIIVTSKGTVTVRRDIERIGTASKRAHGYVSELQGLVSTFISAAAIQRLTTYADTFTGIQNRLALVTSSTEELAAKQQELLEIANSSRSSFADIATLYQRTAASLKDYGVSAERTTSFVNLLAKASQVSGSSAVETSNAIRQLTQGFASGELRGEEFRSVSEQLSYVLDTLQVALGKTRGELRDMAFDGQLTPNLILEAFEKMGATIEGDFSKLTVTIGQALTVLDNAFINLVGRLNESTGAFNIVAQAILFVANNIDLVMLALTPFAAALTVVAVQTIGSLMIGALSAMVSALAGMALFITGTAIPALASLVGSLVSLATAIVTTAIPAFARFTAVLITNPLIALGAAAIIAGVIAFREQIVQLGKDIYQTTLQIASLEEFGNFDNGEFNINVNGQNFASQASGAISSAGREAAEMMKNGIKDGASTAKVSLEQAAIAQYEALNGKVIKPLGNVLIGGGDYIYNQVTGAVEKARDGLKSSITEGADTIGNTMIDASHQGGQAIGQSITSAGSSMGNNLFSTLAELGNVWSNALNSTMDRLIVRMIQAQMSLINAQAAEASANARKANKEAQAAAEGGGGASYGGSSGRKTYTSHSPSIGRGINTPLPPSLFNPGGMTGRQETTETTQFTINNIIDPRQALDAIDTAEGSKTITNIIRNNPEEIRNALGIR